MSKPENVFIDSIHRCMAPLNGVDRGFPYREKMHNPLRGGTWDVYYSGSLAELWVEYKFIILPVKDETMIRPDLSHLQLVWGRGRAGEGRRVIVIVGCKEGGVVFEDFEWEKAISTKEFKKRLLDRKRLANYIIALTQGTV